MQLRKLVVLGVVCAAAVAAATAPRSNNLRHRASVSDDLRAFEAKHSTKAVRVIAHGTETDVRTAAARHGVPVVRVLTGGVVLEATTAQLDALRDEPAVEHLSGDLPVADFMTVSKQATLANQVYAGKAGGLLGLGGIPGLTGQGAVVAVLDSGISAHKALTGKILASVSMIAGEPTTDEYGHGTHIAGIITGTGTYAAGVTTQYTGGIAPGAQVVNVRVLGDDGVGNTSDVIAGIDWVISNKAKYNIKIMNLSLDAANSYIPAHYPAEHIAGSGNNAYLRMSGTSMSAPMITGAAALLLQAQPSLTTAQVKFLLQTGSTYMVDAGVFGAGAGNAQFWTSRQGQANSNLVTNLLSLLLDRTGRTSFWDSGPLQERLYNGGRVRSLWICH